MAPLVTAAARQVVASTLRHVDAEKVLGFAAGAMSNLGEQAAWAWVCPGPDPGRFREQPIGVGDLYPSRASDRGAMTLPGLRHRRPTVARRQGAPRTILSPLSRKTTRWLSVLWQMAETALSVRTSYRCSLQTVSCVPRGASCDRLRRRERRLFPNGDPGVSGTQFSRHRGTGRRTCRHGDATRPDGSVKLIFFRPSAAGQWKSLRQPSMVPKFKNMGGFDGEYERELSLSLR